MAFGSERHYAFESDQAQGRFTSRTSSHVSYRSPTSKRARSKDWGRSSVSYARSSSGYVDELTPLVGSRDELCLGRNNGFLGGLFWRITDKLYDFNLTSSVLLLLLGAITALVDWGQDISIDLITDWREALLAAVEDEHLKYFLYILYGVVMFCVAMLITALLSPVAAGSGIPEMKATLAGAEITNLLSFRTLITKIVGLVFAIGGGMSIGKEGPFVHTSAIIANQLLSLPFSKRLRENRLLTHQILAAACAVGVSSTFGAPIGGVLFSIEVTTEYYMLSNYWKGFISAVASACVSWMHKREPYIGRYNQESTQQYDYANYEFIAFISLGVIGGIVGASFVRMHEQVIHWRRQGPFSNKYFQKAFPYMWAFLTMAVVYPSGYFMRESLAKAMKDLMCNDNLQKIPDHDWDNRGHVIYNILLFIFLRWLLTIGSITLPIPTGVFGPILGIGAGLGRLMGEILYMYNPNISRGGYALMGAAAMAGGATRTISSAVIVFEVTQAPQFLLPSLVAVLISITVGNRLSRSIYDSILYTKGLPYLPRLSKLDKNKNKHAHEIMQKGLIVIEQKTTYADIACAILREDKILQSYPLVSAKDSMYLLGAISRGSLEIIIYDYLLMKNIVSPLPRNLSLSEDSLFENDPDSIPNLFKLGLDDDKIALMTDEVSLLGHPTTVFDPSPFQVVQDTPLSEIHFMFTMLRCSHLFVTHLGKLVGVIVLRDLMK